MSGCTGERDKTKFVATSQLTDMDMLSDYRLLEEASRYVNNAFRNYIAREKCVNSYGNLPQHLFRLITECRKRGTHLRIMPAAFTRRKGNNTWYNVRERRIIWFLELVFPEVGYTVQEKSVPEETRLEEVVNKVLTSATEEDGVLNRLSGYQTAGIDGLAAVIKESGRQNEHSRFVEMDFSKPLSKCFRGITIVEFPTIFIVNKSSVQEYLTAADRFWAKKKQAAKGPAENVVEVPSSSSDTSSDDDDADDDVGPPPAKKCQPAIGNDKITENVVSENKSLDSVPSESIGEQVHTKIP